MPNARYLAYEGFPLESVLARVNADHGAAATITSADRVRRGGVKGFFAREVFQVIVDLGEIDPEDVEGALALHLVEEDDMTFDDAYGDDADLWALLAAGAEEASRFPDPPDALVPPVVSLPELSPELSALQPEPQPEPLAPQLIDAHLPEVQLPVSVAALLAAAPPVPVWASPVRADLPFVTETVNSEAIAAELVQPLRSIGPIASTTVIPSPMANNPSVFGTPFDPFRRVSIPQSDEVVAHTVATYAETGVAPTPIRSGARGVEPQAVATSASGLRRLRSMLDSLDASLPETPALPHSGVIVVVGERDEAMADANRIAAQLGLGSESVLVASPSPNLHAPTAAELAGLAQAAASRATPQCVVVVELLAGRQGHDWTRAVSIGLAAAQVRFVCDASRYIAHQHLSVAAIGGVDVVDLVHMDEVAEPTAALAIGVPIGSLDGRPATTELWAATLLASRAITVESETQSSTAWFGAEGE